MKKSIILTATLLFVFSCKNKDVKATSISQITSHSDSLKIRIKNVGDSIAYDELYHGFKDSNEAESIDSVLVYSKIMAKKYNYPNACFHYFDAICEKNGIDPYNDFSKINLTKLDSNSREEAVDCLIKMLENKIITKEDYNKVVK